MACTLANPAFQKVWVQITAAPACAVPAHLLVITKCSDELLHRDGLAVGQQVPLRCYPASVDQNVGISCRRQALGRLDLHHCVQSVPV